MHPKLALMKPFFGSVKEEQARASIERYEESLALPQVWVDAVETDVYADFLACESAVVPKRLRPSADFG